jgi:hypothetical protein
VIQPRVSHTAVHVRFFDDLCCLIVHYIETDCVPFQFQQVVLLLVGSKNDIVTESCNW